MELKKDRLERLAESANVTLRDDHGLRLVHIRDAPRIIDAAEHFGALIVGLDVVRLQDRVTQATDHVADYSSLVGKPREEACASAAASSRMFLGPILGQEDAWIDFTIFD